MVSVVANEDFQFFLRVFNATNIRTEAFIKGITQTFCSLFYKKSSKGGLYPRHDHTVPPLLDDLMVTINDPYQIKAQDWSSNMNTNNNDSGDPQSVYIVLEATLKDTLERLKMISESIRIAGSGLWMFSSGADFSGHAALIRSLCRDGKLEEALQLRNRMFSKRIVLDVFTQNHLVDGLCKMGDLKSAKEMLEVGPTPNCTTYNTLIHGYCRLDNIDEALYLFSSMGANGVKPNRVTCNILVHALCKKGLLENAKKLLTDILDEHVDIDSGLITSTIFMDGCFKKGDVVQALEIWDNITLKGAQFDTVAYNVIINGFCSRKEMRLAFAYFCEMLKKGYVPDIFTYNTLISGLCKEGKFDEACDIYGAMLTLGVPPDQITYKVIIQSLCLNGYVDKANKFLLSMIEGSLVPEPLIWNLLIEGYGKCGDINRAILVREWMEELRVKENIFTYNALVHAQIKRGSIIDAHFIKQEMTSKGILPDAVTYNMLIGAVCKIGYVNSYYCNQLCVEMLRSGYKPDVVTYTELIKGHCKGGNVEIAVELLFSHILRSSLPVDHVPFQILIKKFCNLRDPKRALDIYQDMVRKGLKCRPSAYLALIVELRRKGFIQEAIQVCSDMDTLGLMM